MIFIVFTEAKNKQSPRCLLKIYDCFKEDLVRTHINIYFKWSFIIGHEDLIM